MRATQETNFYHKLSFLIQFSCQPFLPHLLSNFSNLEAIYDIKVTVSRDLYLTNLPLQATE
jgi:hypothetical protein